MRTAVRRFSEKLPEANVALLFYAGHGLQVAGKNYLVPIDAQIETQADLDFGTIDLDLVVHGMEADTRTNIVFLDACRDNPLAANLTRRLGTRVGAVGRGLAQVDTSVGTLIAFSTQPGNVALDGEGRNSPFTSALLKTIETPGLPLSDVMIDVRNDVLRVTNRKQVPWDNSSLTGQFYFKPLPAGAATSNPGGEGVEIAYWNSIKDTQEPATVRGLSAALSERRVRRHRQDQRRSVQGRRGPAAGAGAGAEGGDQRSGHAARGARPAL